jgi:hypothetical protein
MIKIELEFPTLGQVTVTGETQSDAEHEAGCAAAWEIYCAAEAADGVLVGQPSIPMRPDKVYKEWVSWSDWIGCESEWQKFVRILTEQLEKYSGASA